MLRSLGVLSVFIGLILTLAEEPKGHREPTPAEVKELETFAGTWEIVAVKPEGATKEARQLVFRKNLTYSALNEDHKELWAGTFDLDPDAQPKVWDHRSNDSQKDGTDVLGIYELEDNKLRASCVVGKWKNKEWIGKPRPKNFSADEADVTLELRRIKPNAK